MPDAPKAWIWSQYKAVVSEDRPSGAPLPFFGADGSGLANRTKRGATLAAASWKSRRRSDSLRLRTSATFSRASCCGRALLFLSHREMNVGACPTCLERAVEAIFRAFRSALRYSPNGSAGGLILEIITASILAGTGP